MAIIQFDNGVKVEFNGNPTPKDVEEVANKLGINKPTQKKSLLQKADNLVVNTLGKASDFMFGSTSKTAGTMIASTILEAQGKTKAAQKLREQNFTPTNAAFTALEIYPGGGFVSKYLKKIPGGQVIAEAFNKLPEKMKASAIKQYSEGLGATTNVLKSKTAKVVHQLLEQKVTGSLNKINKLANQKLLTSSEAIKKAENIIPVFKKQAVEPIIERASKLRNAYIVNGKILDDGAVKSIDNVVSSITQFGKEIPETQLVKIKRILDKSVALANKNFTKEEGLTLAAEAKQGIVNTIRNVLNSSNPKLGEANKVFTLWKNVDDITSATIKRRSTQNNGITRFLGPLLGAGGVGAASGSVVKSAIAYFATDGAIRLFNSPAYKTISAVQKNQLAKYLESGKLKEAIFLTSKLLAGIKNENSK